MKRGAASGRAREWAVLAAAFTLVSVLVLAWVSIDRRPPDWDHANHLERAVLCARDIDRGDIESALDRSSFYPPLVLCAAGLVYRVLPSDVMAGELVMLAFLAVGMVSTYLLGRRLGDGTAGVAGALLFLTAPFVLFSVLRFQLDLPLASMVTLALWLLLETERFTRLGPSLAFGVVAGLGMLTKPPFAAYLLPPVAVVLVRVRGWSAWMRVIAAAGAVAVLDLPWYGPRLVGLPLQIGARSYKQAAESGHPDPMTWTALTLYPRWLPAQLGVVGVLLCLVGLVIAIRRREGSVVVALLAPFALFEVLQNKNLRYTLPLLPLAAALGGLAWSVLRGRVRSVVAGIALLAAALQVSGTLAAVPPVPWPSWLDAPWLLASPPDRADWKQREIMDVIVRHSGGVEATVSVVPNAAFFSVSNFRYYAVRDRLPLRFVRAWDEAPVGVDYMIIKTGDQGPTWTAEKPRRIAERLRTDPALARVFPVIGEFSLPDGSRATIRARHVPAVDADTRTMTRAIEAALRNEMPEYARDVDALNVVLEADDSIRRGRVRRMELRASAASVGELRRPNAAVLRIHDVRVVVDDLLVNPWSATERQRLDLLDAGRVSLDRATISGADLQAFLRGLRRFRDASVRLEDGAMAFTLAGRGPTLDARVALLASADRPFALSVDRVRYAGVPVPSQLANWVVRNFDPTPRLAARLPVPVRIGRVSVTAGAIRIAPPTEDRRQ